jgi:hypothetical protein
MIILFLNFRRSILKFMIQRCTAREARGKIQSVAMAMLVEPKVNMECMDLLSKWVVVTMKKILHHLICKEVVMVVVHQAIMVVHHRHLHRRSHPVPLPLRYPLHRQIQSAT